MNIKKLNDIIKNTILEDYNDEIDYTNFNKMYNLLIDNGYFSEEALSLATHLKGNTIETLQDCIYIKYGYRDIVEFLKNNNF